MELNREHSTESSSDTTSTDSCRRSKHLYEKPGHMALTSHSRSTTLQLSSSKPHIQRATELMVTQRCKLEANTSSDGLTSWEKSCTIIKMQKWTEIFIKGSEEPIFGSEAPIFIHFSVEFIRILT